MLEDDYDSEFRYDGPPLPSLQGLDSDHRVIYVGTFSKAMFAGIRMGYIVVPPHLADAFTNASAKLLRPGNLHLQAALADFIHLGHFSQHIKRMREEYGERQSTLRSALKERLGEMVQLSEARAGLHLFTRLSEQVNYERIIQEARKDGLVLGLPYFVGSRPDLQSRSIILGYGGVPLEEIEAGVVRLAKAVSRSRRA
nr:PLP-dependent aminotransferase family protein [Herbaspirillum sp. B65]